MSSVEQKTDGKRQTGTVLVLDTETTGLPVTPRFGQYYSYKRAHDYQCSRIVQVAYLLFDSEHKLVKRVSHLVKPDDFTIPNDMIHGISHMQAAKDGKAFVEIVKELEQDLENVKLVVAHNVDFDRHVLCAELFRRDYTALASKLFGLPSFCTCQQSVKRCNLVRGGKLKLPKLIEAYSILVKEPTDKLKLHDALVDAEMCSRIYFVLLKE